MTILSKTFFSFVSCHLVAFSFLSAWHDFYYFLVNVPEKCFFSPGLDNYFLSVASLTSFINTLAGLNAGILCSGMMSVVPFDMLRAVFLERVLMMKLPKPRR